MHDRTDRFADFSVSARPNLTARTVELPLTAGTGWLSHLAILDEAQARQLEAELHAAIQALVEQAGAEPGLGCRSCSWAGYTLAAYVEHLTTSHAATFHAPRPVV